jgi:hypothetical protein
MLFLAAAILLWAGSISADVAPTTWGSIKFRHLDEVAPLDLINGLVGAPDAVGRPLIFEGTYRDGNYRGIAYNWLTYPLTVTAFDSDLREAAVGIGKFNFVQDGARIFHVLDVLVQQAHHYSMAEKPAVVLFMFESVASRYKWDHDTLKVGTAEFHAAVRLVVDMWFFDYARGARPIKP